MLPPLSIDTTDAERQRTARDALLARILDRVRADDRVLAVLDYGSTSEGRGDAWSDIDLALSIRPDAWDAFTDGWRDWLDTCGPVLLGFVSFVGHPWAVIGTDAAPVRVDLHLYGGPPDGDLVAALPSWPNAPASTEAMLLFDREGTLAEPVAALVGRSLAPEHVAATGESVAGHFWYYAHRTWSKLHRDSSWDVRWNLTCVLSGNLCALLRLESGAVDRWAASDAASGIEDAISPERLERLNRCIPGPDPATLLTAFRETIDLGAEVCATLASRLDVAWPEALAAEIRGLLDIAMGDIP
jgi:hypothetical protein